MDGVRSPNSVATRPPRVDTNLTGQYFGNPTTKGTPITYDFMNDIIDELKNVINAYVGPFNPSDSTQLLQALQAVADGITTDDAAAFVKKAGDTMSGALIINNTLTVNNQSSLSPVSINGSGNQSGANLQLVGNGTTTPKKWLRAFGGRLSVVNDAYSREILSVDDTGNLAVYGGSSWFAGSVSVVGTLGAANISATDSAYVTNSLTTGSFTVNGGAFVAQNLNVNGQLNANGAVSSNTLVQAPQVYSTNGNVTANNGRLRASFTSGGDPNAAVLYAEFGIAFSGNAAFVSLPNGYRMQAYPFSVPNPGGMNTYFFGMPNMNNVVSAICSYLGTGPPNNIGIAVQPWGGATIAITANCPAGAGTAPLGVVVWAMGN